LSRRARLPASESGGPDEGCGVASTPRGPGARH